MRLGAMVIVASLACMACSMASPGKPPVFEIGKALTLRSGESAQTRDAGLRLGFDGVTADSRCPKGEQCFRAGDATVRVWLQQGGGSKEAGELKTSTGAAQAVRLLGYEVRLLNLDPYPMSGKSIASADYIATLQLSRGSTDAPDR
jgi:hypothetical protein